MAGHDLGHHRRAQWGMRALKAARRSLALAGRSLTRAVAAGAVVTAAVVTAAVAAPAHGAAHPPELGPAGAWRGAAVSAPERRSLAEPTPSPSATPTQPPETPPPSADPTPTAAPPSSPRPSTDPPARTDPPGQPDPVRPPRGVKVSTSDVALGSGYWNSRDTLADLWITVMNTGKLPESGQLRYTLPAGLTDTGTAGCSPAGGRTYGCAWTADAGIRSTLRVRVRVDPDAWRQMPLSGSARVVATTASRPRTETVTDEKGFAVLFPAGPPAAGITLSAGEVTFDVSGRASTLEVRLGNTGETEATGAFTVTLPSGVTVPVPLAGCQAAGAERTRCDLGAIRAGLTGSLRIPLAASPDALRRAPLSGAVVGTLTPRVGTAKRVQMSFRIVAAGWSAGLEGGSVDPAASQGALPVINRSNPADGLSGGRRRAAALIAVAVLLVLLALMAANTSKQRSATGPAGTGPANEETVP
jgi:hypothetical protein